mgnify:FL=1
MSKLSESDREKVEQSENSTIVLPALRTNSFAMHLTILEAVMVWQIIKGGNARFDFVEFMNLFETP